MSAAPPPGTVRRRVRRWEDGAPHDDEDLVAGERPLEIRVDGRALSVTLRTPGDDADLALGFLAAEGVLAGARDVESVGLRPAVRPGEPDVADVTLAATASADWSRFERAFASTAACGICGRSHLDSLHAGLAAVPAGGRVAARGLLALPGRVREAQPAFGVTGGVHAAAWCDEALQPVTVREDIGRHNAVDKVCGARLQAGAWPVGGGVLWTSGRAGAELVLKAIRARIPVFVAVGAPSSLAIELAERAGLTLVGFLRDGRMNVYAGAERIA